MKTLALVLPFVALAAFAQFRDDSFTTAPTITSVTFWPQADGGCQARVCATTASDDGGVTLSGCSDTIALQKPQYLTACANIAAGAQGVAGNLFRFTGLDAGGL